MSVAFPVQAKLLMKLLEADQEESKTFSRKYYWNDKQDSEAVKAKKVFRERIQGRAKQMLQILEEIGEPSLSNIGKEAAQAMSILATHSSLKNTQTVLAAFELCYKLNRENAYYQAIPSMTDWVLLLSRKPQRFGTIWLFDKSKQPYLPTVEDFKNVNERRAKYDIEPLRWPKSLAISENEQPWLEQPLSRLVMREPTDEEYDEFATDFL